eukprot:9474847-Pyramimonas_sp.AAC.1
MQHKLFCCGRRGWRCAFRTSLGRLLPHSACTRNRKLKQTVMALQTTAAMEHPIQCKPIVVVVVGAAGSYPSGRPQTTFGSPAE